MIDPEAYTLPNHNRDAGTLDMAILLVLGSIPSGAAILVQRVLSIFGRC